MNKSLDGILRPTTKLEDWQFWMNRMETELRMLSYYAKKKIEVKYYG
jgi:hypothetical protein